MDWEWWTLHVVEPETCEGQEAPRLGDKRPWRASFGEQELSADVGRTSANIVGQTGTLWCFLESCLPDHREVRACLEVFSLCLAHPQQLALGTDLGNVSLVHEYPSVSSQRFPERVSG